MARSASPAASAHVGKPLDSSSRAQADSGCWGAFAYSGNAGNDRADDRVQWGKESGPFCRFNVDGSNHEGDYINAPRPSPRPSSSSPSCVPPSPSLRLATSHSKCMKCKTRPKARRALFTPSTPQPIAISSSPLTSKGGTAAQNYNAVKSYEATTVLYPNISAEYQSPSIICGGAATPAGCNSPYLVTMSSGPSYSNLYKE